MLTQEQLEILSRALTPLFHYLEQEVITNVAERIAESLSYTRTAELQAIAMRELGYSPAKIRSEAMKLLKADPDFRKKVALNTLQHKREVRKLLEKIGTESYNSSNEVLKSAGDLSWAADLSLWKEAGKALTDDSFLPKLVEAFALQTGQELKNMTRTTGFKTMSGYEAMENLYQRELDKALVKVCSGTFSKEKVIRDTIHNLAQSGLRSIDFASGHSMQLDTAVQLAVRTGCHQIAAKVTDSNIKKTGENLVYVSKHWGARNKGEGIENHEKWQGKVYCIEIGLDYTEESKRIGQANITDLWEATGYSIDGKHENDPRGLYGYNCRHGHYVWFFGISKLPAEDPEPAPITIDGKTYDYYAISQKMRSMERAVRALKREKEVLGRMGMDTKEIDAKIKRKTEEYKEFCKTCHVKENTARMRYECGTSDLKKTKAWKEFEDSSAEKGKILTQQGGIYDKVNLRRHFVPGNNTIFTGKTIEEKAALAVDMVKEVTDRKSRWNGVAGLNIDMQANGRYKFDGSMEFKKDADNRTYLHEALHSASAPYISAAKRSEVRTIEEASVELLARELLKEKNIPYSYMDKRNVNALVRINDIMDIENTGLKYAALVYNIHPDERLAWISGKVNRFLEKHKEYEQEMHKLLDELR